MSWQEELRKLDEELAAGRLSADDYRVRRDQVLSSAVTQGDAGASPAGQEQQGQSGADSTQVIPPVSPPQGTPQQGNQGGQGSADATQIVPGQGFDAERTQAVQPGWQAQPPNQFQQQQPGPASPAGGFPQAGPNSPAGGFQQPAQPPHQAPWNAPDADLSPPWGGSDFPPIAPAGSSEWVKQGPEVFEEGTGKSNKGKIIAIVAAVVLLAGVAFAAYMLWGRGEPSAGPQTSTEQSPQNPPSQPPDPLPTAELPGQVEPHDDIKKWDDVEGLNYLNPDELASYEATKPTDTKFAVRLTDGGGRIVVMLTKVGDVTAAGEEVSTLANIQVNNGAQRADDAPPGVLVTEFDKDGTAQVRAHYVSGDVLVRIDITGKELSAVQQQFTTVSQAQLQLLPADG